MGRDLGPAECGRARGGAGGSAGGRAGGVEGGRGWETGGPGWFNFFLLDLAVQ